MHKDKRIMNWQPFMNKVYNSEGFWYWGVGENLALNNKDNTVFMS